jgi:hypothetical protein
MVFSSSHVTLNQLDLPHNKSGLLEYKAVIPLFADHCDQPGNTKQLGAVTQLTLVTTKGLKPSSDNTERRPLCQLSRNN